MPPLKIYLECLVGWVFVSNVLGKLNDLEVWTDPIANCEQRSRMQLKVVTWNFNFQTFKMLKIVMKATYCSQYP